MDLQDAVELIKPAFAQPRSAQVWADLGAGSGLFTRALAGLLEGSIIHAVDKRKQTFEPTFKSNAIVFHRLDFSDGVLPFANLDGILMANSLHFVKKKYSLLSNLRERLCKTGQLLIIEYEINEGNEWVPYPIPCLSLKELLTQVGFERAHVIGERQSTYGRRKMYACTAINGLNTTG